MLFAFHKVKKLKRKKKSLSLLRWTTCGWCYHYKAYVCVCFSLYVCTYTQTHINKYTYIYIYRWMCVWVFSYVLIRSVDGKHYFSDVWVSHRHNMLLREFIFGWWYLFFLGMHYFGQNFPAARKYPTAVLAIVCFNAIHIHIHIHTHTLHTHITYTHKYTHSHTHTHTYTCICINKYIYIYITLHVTLHAGHKRTCSKTFVHE